MLNNKVRQTEWEEGGKIGPKPKNTATKDQI